MQSTTVLRTGLPRRRLAFRVLIPLGVVLLVCTVPAATWIFSRLLQQDRLARETAARTVFETHWTVTGTPDLAGELQFLSGYERVWVLDATGYVLASNRPDEIGDRIDGIWWRAIEPLGEGFFSLDVPFGNESMALSGIRDIERGRSVVLLQQAIPTWPAGVLAFGGVLGLSLIIWLFSAFLLWSVLSGKISDALRKLDERAIQLIRGDSVSEAALDKLSADTALQLGGHAEVFADLVRQLAAVRSAAGLNRRRFRVLFDSIGELGLIRSGDGRLLAVNKALCDELGVQDEWLEGRPFQVLESLLPVRLLEGWFSRVESSRVGVNRMELFPGETDGVQDPMTVTMQPVDFEGTNAWLILAHRNRSLHDAEVMEATGSGDGSVSPIIGTVPSDRTRLLQAITDRTAPPCAVFDDDGDTLFVSQALFRMTGLQESDLPTLRAFVDRVFADEAEAVLFREWIAGEPQKRSIELQVASPDGRVACHWYATDADVPGQGTVGIFRAGLSGSSGMTPAAREPGENVEYS